MLKDSSQRDKSLVRKQPFSSANHPLQTGLFSKRALRAGVVAVAASAVFLQPVFDSLPLVPHAGYVSAEVSAAANTKLPAIRKVSETVITAGAKRVEYIWSTQRSGKQVELAIHVIEVDLSNPNVSISAMSGKNNQVGNLNTVLRMANENKAVAAINADVYDMSREGAPLGAVVIDHTLVSSPARLDGMYSFAITSDGTPVIDNYTFTGQVKTASGAIFPLEGINQSAYTPETGISYSHFNMMHIYTSSWGGAERPRDSGATPTEVLVENGVVTQISAGKALDGNVPPNGYILRAHGTAASFIKDNMNIGDTLETDYSLVSSTTGNKVEAASLATLVGGHTLLVDGGKAVSFSRSVAGVGGTSITSRTAVGYSQDKKKAFLVTSERNGTNTGMTLVELQQALVQLGVYKATNLDGGGSTTMITRPLGSNELVLAHATQYGSVQRSVSNGLGVFSLAPAGKLKNVLISGKSSVFIGEEMGLSANAYDTYYNPFALEAGLLNWSTSGGATVALADGTSASGRFKATKAGNYTVKLTSGEISATHEVKVHGQSDLTSLTINAPSGLLKAGSEIAVPVVAQLASGAKQTLPSASVQWELIGFNGSVKDGVLTIDSVPTGTKNGYAIARYDGFPTMLPLASAGNTTESLLENFEAADYSIKSAVTPSATTKGSAAILTPSGGTNASKVLQITYDFSEGEGTKASYAVFGSGKALPGRPDSLTLDVQGDNSGNWLRAEVIDGNGKAQLIDLSKKIDFTGWKQLKVDLAGSGLVYPLTLSRIYVVSIPQGADNRASTGAISLDNLKLQYSASPEIQSNKVVTLTLGSKQALVNEDKLTMDVKPLLLNGVTYVPVRFVSDALNGVLRYNHASKSVTVARGSRLVEMLIGKKELRVNGQRLESEVAPIERGGRTLVPVRVLSEQLGLKVTYDKSTNNITIR